MRNRLLILGCILAVLLIAFITYPREKDSDGYQIKIELDSVPNHLRIMVLNWDTEEIVEKDFIGQTSVEFVVKDSVTELSIFYIFIDEILEEEKSLNRLIRKILYIGNEQVTIKGDVNNIEVYTNSETQKVLEQWYKEADYILKPLHKIKKVLYEAYVNGVGGTQEFKDNMAIRDELELQEENLLVDFISKHRDSETSAFLLTLNHIRFPVNTVQELYDTLGTTIKNSKYNEEISAYLTTKVLERGDTWNDFKAVDTNGDSLSLSEIEKATDKYMLLAFARNGCIPCESSISELKDIYAEHHNKLEIVSYYQEMTVEEVKSKANINQMEWTCLGTTKESDLRTLRAYDAYAVPKFVLVSPERKIVYFFKKGYDEGVLTKKLGNFFRDK